MTILTLRLEDKTLRELKSLSRAERRPVSDIVRESLEKTLRAEKYRRLRRKALPFAEAAGLLTDEDVFKALA